VDRRSPPIPPVGEASENQLTGGGPPDTVGG
jgi:hypothetical protein